MQRFSFSKIATAAIVSVLLAAGTAPAIADSHTGTFVSSAIKNLGAESVRCPKEVRAAVRSRRMVAVCAQFDGDFEKFRERWAERMELAPPPGLDGNRNAMPQPRTSWEQRDGTYERIYAVGDTAIGVRFSSGQLMLVYSE